MVVSSLRLDADEGTLGRGDILEVVALADLCGNGLVDLVQLVPLLVLNVVSTSAEAIKQPGVVVSKIDIRDLSRVVSTDLLEDVLQLSGDVHLELKSIAFTVGEALLVDVVSHRLDLLARKSNLKGVVTGSDGLQIELSLLNVDGALAIPNTNFFS